jgi:hypothetical protein
MRLGRPHKKKIKTNFKAQFLIDHDEPMLNDEICKKIIIKKINTKMSQVNIG